MDIHLSSKSVVKKLFGIIAHDALRNNNPKPYYWAGLSIAFLWLSLDDFIYMILSTIEETLEMIGMTVLIYSLLEYLRVEIKEIRVRLVDPDGR